MKSNKRAILLTIILLLATVTWSFAEKADEIAGSDEEAINLLTYEEAAEKAINNSYELRNQLIQLEKLEEQREEASKLLGGVEDSSRISQIKKVKSLDTSLELAKKEIEIQREKTALEVKNMMDEVNKLIRDKTITEEELNIAKKELEFDRAKELRGLISKYELEKSEETYNVLEKEQEVLYSSIEAAYTKLNSLLDLKDIKGFIFEEELEYVPIEKEDIDNLSRRLASSDPSILSQQKRVEMAELDLILYVYNSGGDSYSIKEIDLQLEKNNLQNLKKNLEESTETVYNQIQQLEKNYELLKVNLEGAEKDLAYVRAQYDLGLAVDLQLKEAELKVLQLKNDLKNRAIEHGKLKTSLYKPYL